MELGPLRYRPGQRQLHQVVRVVVVRHIQIAQEELRVRDVTRVQPHAGALLPGFARPNGDTAIQLKRKPPALADALLEHVVVRHKSDEFKASGHVLYLHRVLLHYPKSPPHLVLIEAVVSKLLLGLCATDACRG